jgi:hypothetical protein
MRLASRTTVAKGGGPLGGALDALALVLLGAAGPEAVGRCALADDAAAGAPGPAPGEVAAAAGPGRASAIRASRWGGGSRVESGVAQP